MQHPADGRLANAGGRIKRAHPGLPSGGLLPSLVVEEKLSHPLGGYDPSFGSDAV
jgi:hypothetical protein